MQLDLPTLMVAGSFVAATSGVFLLMVWVQNHEARGALWWAAGNLVLATGVPLLASPAVTLGVPSAVLAIMLLNISPALIWAAARSCNNQKPNLVVVGAGAVVWLAAFAVPGIRLSAPAQMSLNLAVMAIYLYAAAFEFWRERLERLQSRWPLIVLLVLHGLFFTIGAFAAMLGDLPISGGPSIGSWLGLIYFETLIFVIGTAVFTVAMAFERGVLRHKVAASVDSLTGVATRRAFLESAEMLLEESLRAETALSLIVFDLDSFKAINDTYGHALGDKALKEFGLVTRRVLRSSDLIGRLGGEEFAVALPGSSVGAAYVVAERIRVAFAEACRAIGGHTINATVSAGVTTAHPRSTLDALIAAADSALYQAKAEGRNRVETRERSQPAAEVAPAIVEAA
jgi:diguanylate cyclase (GGDEF)-like protein